MAFIFLTKKPPVPPPPGSTLWTWGYNPFGNLGLGDTTNRSSPVQVGSDLWDISKSGDSGYNPLIIKDDGTLWTWGWNNEGQLGQGDIINRSSPVQVGSLTDWSSVIDGGSDNILVVKTDGTLWAWGENTVGSLGLGDITHRSSPVQVGSLTDWSSVDSGGGTLAVKTDGTLWAWGNNSRGMLGLGNETRYSSPVQVGSLTDWSSAHICSGMFSFAIKTDGTLWAWGDNTHGQLGLGDITHRSSPVQVGSDTNWSKVGPGSTHALALKTDGTLWTWGRNSEGQLGFGTTSLKVSSPVQVGSSTNWSDMAIGSSSFAIKDGALWTMGGRNDMGTLGQGDTVYRSSPVQIGSNTDWTGCCCGTLWAMGFRTS